MAVLVEVRARVLFAVALGETSVVLEYEGQSASGQGVATDIIEAAGRAYVRALSNAVRKVQLASEAVDLGANEPVGAP